MEAVETMDFAQPPQIGRDVMCDQYANGIAAKVWEYCIGDDQHRTQNYKDFLINLLRRKGCKRVLDASCGTGVDSIMLLEEGFEVMSVDGSDQMLKYALKKRWKKRKEPIYDNWIIEEANWLTLYDDIKDDIKDGFDAVICLGNSFAHLLDNHGDYRDQKKAIYNFNRCIKPGGLLLIDHRNYESIFNKGKTPVQSIYYNSKHLEDITTTVLITNGKPWRIINDYRVNVGNEEKKDIYKFRMYYHPYKLDVFTKLLNESFSGLRQHTVFGDFKYLDEIKDPGYYIHLVEKNVYEVTK